MRSLDECKAEVFRRSEDRIKNKKKIRINRAVIAGLSTAAGIVLTICVIRFIGVLDVEKKTYDTSSSGNSSVNGAGNVIAENEDKLMGSLTEQELDFEVQYIRGSRWGDVEYPCVSVVKSVEELKQYLEMNADENLQKSCAKYDDEYFEKQILILYRISEGSGSTRHNVKSLISKGVMEGDTIGSKLFIEIERLRAEVGTCDMAEWYIVIEPEADFDIDEYNVEIKNMMGGIKE